MQHTQASIPITAMPPYSPHLPLPPSSFISIFIQLLTLKSYFQPFPDPGFTFAESSPRKWPRKELTTSSMAAGNNAKALACHCCFPSELGAFCRSSPKHPCTTTFQHRGRVQDQNCCERQHRHHYNYPHLSECKCCNGYKCRRHRSLNGGHGAHDATRRLGSRANKGSHWFQKVLERLLVKQRARMN